MYKRQLYEDVKDLLDEDEVVTAKDYEIETGSVFDVKSDYTGLELSLIHIYQCSSSDRIDVSDHNECNVMLCSVFTKCDHLYRNQLSVIGSGNPGSGTVLHLSLIHIS